MPEHLLRKGDAALFRRYQQAAGGTVRYLTVAPEVEGVVDMIREDSFPSSASTSSRRNWPSR